MSWLRFFLRSRQDADLAHEIAAHMEAERAENIARGLSPQDADRRAHMKFGSARRVHEEIWQQNSFTLVENLIRDLGHSLRTLARTPGFTFTAILVMALGVGATAALSTLVRFVLLDPLPYPHSSRLVELYEDQGNSGEQYHYIPVAAGSFAEWQRAAHDSADMAMIGPWRSYDVSARGSQLPESVHAGWVSWNFFRVLDVAPALGRDFLASDDRPSSQAEVILSDAFWKRRFAADPAVVGKTILLDARPYTVIGVMPRAFAFPDPKMQLWTAASHEGSHALMTTFEDHPFWAIARLRPGATLPKLLNQLDVVQKQIKLNHPAPSVGSTVVGRTLLNATVGDFKTPLYALLAATFCVLLIACLNVANLLVARSAARQKDLGIRAALGGSRWRLIREQLTESLVLSVAGGALGLGLAWAALTWLQHSQVEIARMQETHLDWWALAFVCAISTITGLIAGLIPSFALHTGQLLETLQSSSRVHSGGRSRARLRKALLTAEVSLTVVLLLGAGLLLKSYQQLRSRDLGCAVDNVLTMGFTLPDARYKEPVQRVAFFEQLLSRVRAQPGVAAAGLSTALPGLGWNSDNNISIAEHPPLPRGRGLDTLRRDVDPGYFAAMQIPLLRGRYLREDERLDRASVVIVDQSAAKQYFPGENPIGRHLKLIEDNDAKLYEIVGVVGKTRWMVSQPPMPTFYSPLLTGQDGDAALVVRGRSNADIESLSLSIQKIFGQLDPDLPVHDVLTMRQNIGVATQQDQFNAFLILVFAIIALVLAAVGLYGVLSYLVTQRTTELGIRMALGAQRTEVMRLTLTDGLGPIFIGLLSGLAGGAAVVQFVRSMLYGMSPFDWSVFATVVVTLTLTACAASILPAWRATRLDPAQAIRTE
jgi:putative ABC transport system permease protein